MIMDLLPLSVSQFLDNCTLLRSLSVSLLFIAADGTLSSSRLSVNYATPDSYPHIFFPSPSDKVSLPTLVLTPVKSLSLSSKTLVASQAALLALHSSFVLLAAPRVSPEGSAPVVSLTYWDARFGAVIASSELSVPSAVATSASSLSLSACLPTRNTAIIALSPSFPAPSSTSSRIALFCLPLSPPLPSSSVLAAIVGRQRLTSQYLATSEATDSVLAKAKKAEPILSSSESFSSEDRNAAQAGRLARETLLETLEKVLAPLKDSKNVKEAEKAVQKAEKEWSSFLEKERKRTWDVERPKMVKRRNEAAEASIEEIKLRWSEGSVSGEGWDGRWKRVKRVVDRAIVEGGGSVEVDAENSGKTSWKSLVKEEMDGIDAEDRAKYSEERSNVEQEITRLRKVANDTLDDSERPEVSFLSFRLLHAQANPPFSPQPSFPSSFITAILRLSFPVVLDTPSTDLTVASASSSSPAPSNWRHPVAIVEYLLKRDIVGENQLEGGLTRYLARAGDWVSILEFSQDSQLETNEFSGPTVKHRPRPLARVRHPRIHRRFSSPRRDSWTANLFVFD